MPDLVICGGSVVSSESTIAADVYVHAGRVVDVMPVDGAPRARADMPSGVWASVDASGMLVLPGIIDPHVHFGLRSRGSITADDFSSGTEAAAAGGVTTVIDYADHAAGKRLRDCAMARLDEAAALASVDFSVHQNVVRLEPDTLEQLCELSGLGIASVKVFTTYKDAGYMLDGKSLAGILAASRESGILVTVHAESDPVIEDAGRGLIAQGDTSVHAHARSRPAEAEAAAIGAVIEAAASVAGRVYFVHVSTGVGIQRIIAARERGLEVHAETCPHYLLLDESAYGREDAALYIMSPPLRRGQDRAMLWEAMRAGRIDTISTDHCAFTPGQKALGTSCFDTLPGIPGVQTLLPLIYTYGVRAGRLNITDMVRMMCENPARLFGLWGRKGSISPGFDADFVILDPSGGSTLSGDELISKSGYTPYEGIEVSGEIRQVYLRGEIVFERGRFCGRSGGGRYVPAWQGR
ncbi:MAG: dihydropyrimidinase [Clostridia bacterium]|nr:dihydropyrimidinase [Clostridia bacterium]